MHDDLFAWMDLNGDGAVDIVERELAYETCTDHSTSSLDEEEDADDLLANIGLDRYDLEAMDEDERREALEDAGIDPDDFEC